MKDLWDLFWVFVKISISTFGGGYAMLPSLRHELIEKRGYVTENELLDYYAIGQCTPGLFGINVATFIGYGLKKTKGALVATLGVIFPSLVIILIVAMLLESYAHMPVVAHAFAGVRVVVVVLIFNTAVGMWKKSVQGVFGIIVFAAAIAASFFSFISPVVTIIACGIAGAVRYYVSLKKREKEENITGEGNRATDTDITESQESVDNIEQLEIVNDERRSEGGDSL